MVSFFFWKVDDEKSSDELTAYKTDLEYLDDHLQVTMIALHHIIK